MNERRIARLQSLIQQRAAEVIDHELSDPRRGLITITRVVLDREMVSCKIYWSVLGSDAQQRTSERMLDSARGYIQREIGKVLHTRTVPHVTFQFDPSVEGALRIDKILAEERAKQGDTGSDDGDDGDAPPNSGDEK